MEIIITNQNSHISGTLGRGFGYYIRRNKKGRFFGQRSKHAVPPDGHWRFILACATIARIGLHIADVHVGWEELHAALEEARKFIPAQIVQDNYYEKMKVTYNAVDIINLKTLFGL